MTFHRLGFTFLSSCTVVKNTFEKERYFTDNLIHRRKSIHSEDVPAAEKMKLFHVP